MKRKIEDYGNRLTIVGMVLADGNEGDIIFLPEANVNFNQSEVNVLQPTEQELNVIFDQLDTVNITNSQKVVLRKSQRQLSQITSWKVFKRDGYRCVYCGNDDTPLTVDHLVLWEEMGDSVEGNLVTACKKCNSTRGNQQVDTFLQSPYYKRLNNPLAWHPQVIIGMWEEAKKLPLRKPRSR